MKNLNLIAITIILFLPFSKSAQIIYHDIFDVTIDDINPQYDLDMENGIGGTGPDFRISYGTTPVANWFEFINSQTTSFGSMGSVLFDLVVGDVLNLNPSALIEPTSVTWSDLSTQSQPLALYYLGGPQGQWAGGATDAYIGVRFEISGNLHYGWIRVDVESPSPKLTIKDFAYNSIPNEVIAAGDVGSSCNASFSYYQVYIGNGTNSNPTCEVHFANSSIGSLTYQWDLGDGSTSNQEDPQYTYSASGTYTIVLNVYDSLGNFCDSTSGVLQLNCGGGVGIKNVEDRGISLSAYPNPTQDRLSVIVGSEHLGKEFEVIDFLGRVVKEGTITNEKFQLSLSEYNNGIYVLVIRETRTQIKLIKI
jgi:hypothetical protein